MNLLRFSFQAPSSDKAFQRSLLCVEHDPFQPVGALVDGASGVVLITRVSPDLHLQIADAIAAILGSKLVHLTDIHSGESL